MSSARLVQYRGWFSPEREGIRFTRLRRRPRAFPWMNARQGNPPESYRDEGGYASAGSAEECGVATRLRVGLHGYPYSTVEVILCDVNSAFLR